MGLKYFVLLMCIHMAYTQMVVDVLVKNDKITVKHKRQEVHVIEEDDINFFKIDEAQLIDAMEKDIGKRPDAVYIKNPTPYENLFDGRMWKEVSRVMSVDTSSVTSKSIERLDLAEKTFTNRKTKPARINTGLTHDVEYTVNVNWEKENQYTVAEKFDYVIEVSFDGNTSWVFDLEWGKDLEKSEETTIGDSKLKTLVPAGKDATAVLSADFANVELLIEYRISLQGTVVAYYETPYYGKNFYASDIAYVMKNSGISNEIIQAETVQATFYFDHEIVVTIED